MRSKIYTVNNRSLSWSADSPDRDRFTQAPFSTRCNFSPIHNQVRKNNRNHRIKNHGIAACLNAQVIQTWKVTESSGHDENHRASRITTGHPPAMQLNPASACGHHRDDCAQNPGATLRHGAAAKERRDSSRQESVPACRPQARPPDRSCRATCAAQYFPVLSAKKIAGDQSPAQLVPRRCGGREASAASRAGCGVGAPGSSSECSRTGMPPTPSNQRPPRKRFSSGCDLLCAHPRQAFGSSECRMCRAYSNDPSDKLLPRHRHAYVRLIGSCGIARGSIVVLWPLEIHHSPSRFTVTRVRRSTTPLIRCPSGVA